MSVTALQTQQSDVSTQAMVFDPAVISGMEKMAEIMCAAKITVPKHLQGSRGDCLAIIMQSAQWGMNPYAVAQKTHIVNGTLGYEAQLVNAVICTSDLLIDRPKYTFEGDWKGVNGKSDNNESRAVTVSATLSGESAPRALRVAMSQVGSVRNSPLWVSDPRQQLAYLAIKRWARLYAPDVLLGVYTQDELQDHAPVERDMGEVAVEEKQSRAEQIKRRLADKRKAKPDVPVIGINDVLESISNAQDEAALKVAADSASHLPDADKKAARKAYRERLDEINAQTAPEVSFAQVMDAMQQAKTMDELNDAALMIGFITDEKQKDELSQAYNELIDKVK